MKSFQNNIFTCKGHGFCTKFLVIYARRFFIQSKGKPYNFFIIIQQKHFEKQFPITWQYTVCLLETTSSHEINFQHMPSNKKLKRKIDLTKQNTLARVYLYRFFTCYNLWLSCIQSNVAYFCRLYVCIVCNLVIYNTCYISATPIMRCNARVSCFRLCNTTCNVHIYYNLTQSLLWPCYLAQRCTKSSPSYMALYLPTMMSQHILTHIMLISLSETVLDQLLHVY